MNGRFVSDLSPPWNDRGHRAIQLIAQQPHAEELLSFYLRLLQLQEPIYRHTLRSDWLSRVRSAVEGDARPLRLDQLPLVPLLPLLQRFLNALTTSATDVLIVISRALCSAGEAVQTELLELFLHRTGVERLAASLNCEPAQIEFFARAFIQPIAEALAEQNSRTVVSSLRDSCPQCSWPPQVAVIRDEAEVRGHRLLVCSLCATLWSFPRSTCPNCGESRPDRLQYHTADSTPHLRVEECLTCRSYLKSVDLREVGLAVPLVEDLASVELDLWSQERELLKVQRNVLGF